MEKPVAIALGREAVARRSSDPTVRRRVMAALIRRQKPEVKSGEAVANIFRGARPEAEPLGHHRQAATQFPIALFEMISHFAAFKCSEHRVGNSPPSHSLPFLQLMDLAA
jgi:hypothetical protein